MPQVVVDFVANTKDLQRGIKETGNASSGFASKLKGVAKFGALAGGAAGVGALVATLKIGWDEFQQGQKVAAQTAAVLKSTGDAANVTAGHVSKLATNLMKKSGVDDEAIASGENLLLTFTNVRNEVGKGNDVFDQTTKAALDMSVALGTDMKSASMQLGKALNDPLKGITKLTRSGVTFTEGQKKQIAALVKSGHTLQAQKIILGEVNKEFGGSAEAAGKTLPGQINILKESFNNFAGDLVAKLVPALTASIGWLREHWPEIQAVIQKTWATIKPLIAAFGDLVVSVVQLVKDNWGTIGPIIEQAAKVVQDKIKVMIDVINLIVDVLHGDWGKAWAQLKQTVSDAFQEVLDELSLAGRIVGALLKAAEAIGGAILGALVDGLKGIGDAAWNQVKGIGETITGAVGTVKGWGSSIATSIKSAVVSTLVGIGSDAWGVINNIGSFLVTVVSTVKGWGTDVATWIKGAVVSGLGGIGSAAWDVINNVGSFLGTVIDTVKGWGTNVATWIKNAITGGLGGIGNDAWNVLNNIGSFLDGVKDTVTKWGSKIGGWMKDGATSALSGIKEGLVGVIAAAINAAIDTINSGLHAIRNNWPDVPGAPGPPGFLNGLPHVSLAKGGIIAQPTLALLGEGGEREIVSPESLMRSIVAEAHTDVHVRVFIGDQELTSLVRTEVSRSNAGIARSLIAGTA